MRLRPTLYLLKPKERVWWLQMLFYFRQTKYQIGGNAVVSECTVCNFYAIIFVHFIFQRGGVLTPITPR